MQKTKTVLHPIILRFIVCILLVLFSLEITSSSVILEANQMELVDIDALDYEPDSDSDTYEMIIGSSILFEHPKSDSSKHETLLLLGNQHLEELPFPPPEQV